MGDVRRPDVTPARLRELLDYDPSTGVFTWRVCRGGKRRGRAAGSVGNHGYTEIRIDRKLYLAHRLAWLHAYGVWPVKTIDHINRIRTDNRLSNLRSASYSENNINSNKYKSASGYRGVHWARTSRRWFAVLYKDHERFYLGLFDTPEQAHQAYVAAARDLFGAYFVEQEAAYA